MTLMSEVSEERCLERSPMFQGKVSKVVIKTVHNHVQHVQSLLQLPNPVFPLSLHGVQQRGNTR
jgi:hypothetical protein